MYVYGSESTNTPGFVIKNGVTYKIIHDPGTESIRYVVNVADGVIAQEIDYDEFGNIVLNTDPSFQPLGFAGGLYDADTKLVRFGARDYDPVVSRWMSKDPIDFAGGDTNLYAYVGGDPMSWADVTGLDRRICSRRLNSAFTPIKAGTLRHDYVEFRDSTGKSTTKSWGSKGLIDESSVNPKDLKCGDFKKSTDKEDQQAIIFADTLADVMQYNVLGYNCQNFADEVMNFQGGK